MSVGDYIRTKDGIIAKIEDIIADYSIDCDRDVYDLNNLAMMEIPYVFKDEYIIKSSPNIIDLIEVGDILVVKDFVDEACMIFTDIYLIQNEQQLINIKSDLEKNKNKKLYSIVTSEQFSQMEYRIGE